jgi:ribosome-associated heat shock protein Hsp15
MSGTDKIRIDKWLWAVRLFKTRSLAADECRNNKVTIKGMNVKPSREISVGVEIQIKRPPIIRTYLVKAVTGKRMGAPLTVDFVEDITAQDQLDLLVVTNNYGYEKRDRGVGRPTKRDRRDIERLKEI